MREVGRRHLGSNVVLLEALVHDVLVLPGHRVELHVQSRLSSLLRGRGWLELLAVRIHLRGEGSGRELLVLPEPRRIQVHAAELLRGQVQQLLLELMLPLGEVKLSGQQLGSNVGVEVAEG